MPYLTSEDHPELFYRYVSLLSIITECDANIANDADDVCVPCQPCVYMKVDVSSYPGF